MENVKKPSQIFVLDFFQHFLTFLIQILSDIKVFILLLLFLLFLLDFLHLLGVCFVQTKNVVQIPIVDAHLFGLFFYVSALDQLDMNLRSLLQPIMVK